MKALLFHFDIEVRPGAGLDVSLPEIHAMSLRFLHRTGMNFAIAFPQMRDNYFGSKMRVCGYSKDELESLRSELMVKPVISDYVVVGSVADVPVGTVSHYDVFVQMKVKSQHSRERRRIRRNKAPYTQSAQTLIRQKNRELDKVGFLKVQSLSTGQGFKLFVRREEVSPDDTWSPNSFGFSQGQRRVAIPRF